MKNALTLIGAVALLFTACKKESSGIGRKH